MSRKMYDVVPVEYQVFLRTRTGMVYVYDSYIEFIHSLDYSIMDRLGKNFKDCYWNNDKFMFFCTDFVAESKGVILNPEKVKRDWLDFLVEQNQITKHSLWYRRLNRIYVYRYDAVPFIHKRHLHRGSSNRHIRTTQERRMSLAEKEDDIRWRCKRNFHNLPNSWDDIIRRTEKNWKSFRKTQWKS